MQVTRNRELVTDAKNALGASILHPLGRRILQKRCTVAGLPPTTTRKCSGEACARTCTSKSAGLTARSADSHGIQLLEEVVAAWPTRSKRQSGDNTAMASLMESVGAKPTTVTARIASTHGSCLMRRLSSERLKESAGARTGTEKVRKFLFEYGIELFISFLVNHGLRNYY